MRVALVSDLHGNLVALDAVLADIRRIGADAIVCLGDIVDLGPQPAETLARIRDLRCACVQGNHDPLDEHPEHPFLAAMEDWTRERLGADDQAFVAAMPEWVDVDLGGPVLRCVHGSPRSFRDEILDTTPREVLDEWLGDDPFDVLACGHTHVQMVRRLDRRLVVNVGSVGMPFERPFTGPPPRVLPWSEYGIVSAEGGALSAELRRVPYDFDEMVRRFRQSGAPDVERWIGQWMR